MIPLASNAKYQMRVSIWNKRWTYVGAHNVLSLFINCCSSLCVFQFLFDLTFIVKQLRVSEESVSVCPQHRRIICIHRVSCTGHTVTMISIRKKRSWHARMFLPHAHIRNVVDDKWYYCCMTAKQHAYRSMMRLEWVPNNNNGKWTSMRLNRLIPLIVSCWLFGVINWTWIRHFDSYLLNWSSLFTDFPLSTFQWISSKKSPGINDVILKCFLYFKMLFLLKYFYWMDGRKNYLDFCTLLWEFTCVQH